MSQKHSRPNLVTFTKVDTEAQKPIAQQFGITALPTFVLFENGKEYTRVQGASPQNLNKLIQRVSQISSGGGESSGGDSGTGAWMGAALPRGYTDVTDQIDIRGLELLNADNEFGSVRTLFETSKPSSLGSAASGKGKSKATGEGNGNGNDWVESDTDEQLMLFMPFQSTLKVFAIQITSLPPSESDDEIPMRPRRIQLYTNRAHNLGFEEADDMPATQTIELSESDWNKDGTANMELRYVKFQNVSSLVLFVVDGDGDGERTRIDRVRLIGESGAKRDMGKLEKIGDDVGE
jgi:PITH domain/Thioredoxin